MSLEPIPIDRLKKVEKDEVFGEIFTNLASKSSRNYSKNIDERIMKCKNSITDTDLQDEFIDIINTLREIDKDSSKRLKYAWKNIPNTDTNQENRQNSMDKSTKHSTINEIHEML